MGLTCFASEFNSNSKENRKQTKDFTRERAQDLCVEKITRAKSEVQIEGKKLVIEPVRSFKSLVVQVQWG